jgi:hypothetical protein
VLNEVSGLNPEVILSSHLPPAKGITDALLRYLAAAAGESHSLGPGQAAAEAVRGGG